MKENIWPNYTRIRFHDPALHDDLNTLQYRAYIIQREADKMKSLLRKYEFEEQQQSNEINLFDFDQQIKLDGRDLLSVEIQNHDNVTKARILKKLNNLYGGKLIFKTQQKAFINLSSHNIDPDEEEFLNLGLNFHIQPKYDKLHKQTELELLYENILKLNSDGKVLIHNSLADQLRAESTKHRNPPNCNILNPKLRQAANRLQSNKDIIIRRADKSASYVVLNRSDYLDKINDLLSDQSKFKIVNKDPTNDIKVKANKIISCINATSNNCNLSKIVGEYQPGYMYGNVKTHKPNNPLRPIISQVTTPTYSIAKTLSKILTPYIPRKYMLKSTNDLIDLLQTSTCNGITASLDVESLFTNVPIDPTIDIILELVYNNPEMPPPQIPSSLLQQLLSLLTKELPFKSPDGRIFVQIEGVAMGSPLGPLFANFYMAYLENSVFSNPNNRPSIYARYVDDIFIQIQSLEQLDSIKSLFEDQSVLKFTYETSNENKIPFLDTLIDTSRNTFHTKVYHKTTDLGQCLNANSQCSDKYKNSVISNYLHRAFKISQNWHDFHSEVLHIKQTLVNNNYSNTLIDKHINSFINSKMSPTNNNNDSINRIPIYYQAQFHSNYKIEERVLMNIIQSNVKCTDQNSKLNLIFYYKNKKASSLIMKNNIAPPPSTPQKTNVVYKFSCPYPHREAEDYIGLTSTTLSTRLGRHIQTGSIKRHFEDNHNTKPTKSQLLDNTKILTHADNRHKLFIKEALLISSHAPKINRQYDNFTNVLKLYKPRHNNYNNRGTSNDNSEENISILPNPTNTLSPNHTYHPISPQISQRINQLLSNSRNSSSPQPTAPIPRTPISQRLRSSRIINQSNLWPV